MKKIALYIFSLIALFGCLFVCGNTKVKAEEIEQPETTETETPKEEIEIKDVEEIVKNVVKDLVEKYLGNYADKQLIADLSVVVTGVVTYLIVIFINIKYGKYKKGNVTEIIESFKKIDADHLKESLKTAYEKIEKLESVIVELKQSNETIMKVLVLAQDNTAKGKVALLEYLGSKTNNQEIKEAKAEVQKELEAQIETQKEVNEKVEKDYEKIF